MKLRKWQEAALAEYLDKKEAGFFSSGGHRCW